MTTYNLRDSSKYGIPAPKEGYEQRKVTYKKYNEAVIKGWSKRIDDGKDYTNKDFILCERRIDAQEQKPQEVELSNETIFLSTDGIVIINADETTYEERREQFQKNESSFDYINVPEIKPEDIHGILVSGNTVSVTLEKDDDGKFVETSRKTTKKRVRKTHPLI